MRKFTGANLRDARAEFTALGGSVCNIRRTGEDIYSHPAVERTVRVNSRRKDTPRALSQMIVKITRSKA